MSSVLTSFSWYKYLSVILVFSHLGIWCENFFLVVPFPDYCLLVHFYTLHANGLMVAIDLMVP